MRTKIYNNIYVYKHENMQIYRNVLEKHLCENINST